MGFFRDRMKQIIAPHRHFLVASLTLLVLALVALSMATRRPCLQARTGPWHTWKAGHMSQSQQREISATEAAESTEDAVAETKDPPQRYVPHEDKLPIALLLTFQRNHFRSPPVLQ